MINFTGELGVVAPGAGEGPGVLAGAGDFGEDEEGEQGVGAVGDEPPAGDEDEEGGEVVGDEEDVAGEEDEVVEEIGSEVGDAEVEDEVLERGVGRGEAAGFVGEQSVSGQDDRGGPVEDGDQAAGRFGSDLGAPASEYDEVSDEVDCEEH